MYFVSVMMLHRHLGVWKTVSCVREQYYWPKLLTNVKRYVGKCAVCDEQKVVDTWFDRVAEDTFR